MKTSYILGIIIATGIVGFSVAYTTSITVTPSSSTTSSSSTTVTSSSGTTQTTPVLSSSTSSPSSSSTTSSSTSVTSSSGTAQTTQVLSSSTSSPSSSSTTSSSTSVTSSNTFKQSSSSSTLTPGSSSYIGTSGVVTTIPVITSSTLIPATSKYAGTSGVVTTIPVITSSTLIPATSTYSGSSLQAGYQSISDSQTSYTFDPTTGVSQIIIPDNGIVLSSISIPPSVSNPTINFQDIISTKSDGTKLVTMPTQLTIDSTTNSVDMHVAIPSGIKVDGPSSWNGVLNLPTPGSVSVNVGQSNHIFSNIEIGFGNQELTFDQAIRLDFAGQAGDQIGYTYGGPLTEITTTCSDDTQTTNNGLPTGGNCKINAGSDLIVWTKHFSSFVTFGPAPTSSSNSGSSGTGGGSGGGLVQSSGLYNQATQPVIYSVSFDVCKKDMATIVAGPSVAGLQADIRTTLHGLVSGTASGSQNGQTVFTAPLDPNEKFFVAEVYIAGQDIEKTAEQVNIMGCTGIQQVNALPTTKTSLLEGANTFLGSYNGVSFAVQYTMEGTITSVNVDEVDKQVTFNLANATGPLSIRIPDLLVSAPGNSFVVQSDGNTIPFTITASTDGYATLSVTLSKETEKLVVTGATVIPEFGETVSLILTVSLLSCLVIGRLVYQQKNKIKY